MVKRIVVIDQDKVKPNSEAFRYFKRNAGGCGKSCIEISHNNVIVSEVACAVCVNRCKQCPGDAVSVVKLPTQLTSNPIHRYGPNAFELHGLPMPRPGHVLGLLGANGTGKSTALKILSGRLKPNMGNLDSPPGWSSIVSHFRGSDLQNYFQRVLENRLKTVIKPQLESGFVRRLRGKTVRTLLQERDERGTMERYVKDLDLTHLLDRNVEALSGGELQRFATACTVCRDADVYMFDEVTSFLDIRQRIQVTKLIRSLVHEKEGGTVDEWPEDGLASSKKYVIVVEHDLTILDYMSDYVQCLYGSPGAYGVVTARSKGKNGINQFLAGYIGAENMRFRSHELTFKVSNSDHNEDSSKTQLVDDAKPKMGIFEYPSISHTRASENEHGEVAPTFDLHVEAGCFRDGECIALMGENGTGKTTFMEMLAGVRKEQRDEKAAVDSCCAKDVRRRGKVNPSLVSLGVSYKKQGLSPKLRRFKGSVQELLESEINSALGDRQFRLLVMKPLKLNGIKDLPVASLSGGEMQKVSIALCLGVSAMVYLIDEPSAGLDCEQRINAAQVMKRWVVHHLGRTLLLVEHDFVMTAAMADRVIVFEGEPGVTCTARAPVGVAEGFNRFLSTLGITFRRDPTNFRPRINKLGSRIDKEQKASGEYYVLDAEQEEE